MLIGMARLSDNEIHDLLSDFVRQLKAVEAETDYGWQVLQGSDKFLRMVALTILMRQVRGEPEEPNSAR